MNILMVFFAMVIALFASLRFTRVCGK